MSTTVRVKKNTSRLLEELKRKYAAKSVDETVRKLISKAERIPDSMLGAHPKMKPFTIQDKTKVREL